MQRQGLELRRTELCAHWHRFAHPHLKQGDEVGVLQLRGASPAARHRNEAFERGEVRYLEYSDAVGKPCRERGHDHEVVVVERTSKGTGLLVKAFGSGAVGRTSG